MNDKATKKAYEKKFQAQLDEWRAEIDKLRAKAEQADADARIRYQKEIDQLRAMQDDAVSKLERLRRASDDAWLDVKIGLDNAWESFNTALKSAAARFK
jgi:multidrug resistance efflux pump